MPEHSGSMATSVEYPDLRDGWSWWSGNAGKSHYTHWFGTDYRMGGPHAGHGKRIGGFEGEVYWDEGGDHHVAIYPTIGIRDDGDPRVSEYADVRGSYDSKQEAVNAVPDLIDDLGE